MASPFAGIDPQLLAYIQAMGPSEEDKKAARQHALLTAGLGMMANSTGPTMVGIGRGGLLGSAAYNDQLKTTEALRQQSMAQAVQAMNMQRQGEFMNIGRDMVGLGSPSGAPASAPPQGGMPPPQGMPAQAPQGQPQAAPMPPVAQQQSVAGQAPPWANPRAQMGMAFMSGDPKKVADVIGEQMKPQIGPDGTIFMSGKVWGRMVPQGAILYQNGDPAQATFVKNPQQALDAVAEQAGATAGATTAATEKAQFPYRTISGQDAQGRTVTGFQSDVLGAPASQRGVTLDPSLSPAQRQAAMADAQRSGYGGLTGPNPLAMKTAEAAIQTQAEQNNVVAKGQGQDYLNIIDSEKQAPGNIAKYDLMKQYLGKIDTGKLAPSVLGLKSIAAYVAPNAAKDFTKDLPYAQAVSALSNEIALQLRNPTGGAGMPGSMSNSDRDFLVSMTANTANDPRAIPLMLDMRIAMEKRAQEVGQIARDYRKQNGTLDEGFYQQLQNYSNAHPMFDKMAQPSAAGWSIKKLN
jgi:hypothetical protein